MHKTKQKSDRQLQLWVPSFFSKWKELNFAALVFCNEWLRLCCPFSRPLSRSLCFFQPPIDGRHLRRNTIEEMCSWLATRVFTPGETELRWGWVIDSPQFASEHQPIRNDEERGGGLLWSHGLRWKCHSLSGCHLRGPLGETSWGDSRANPIE